MACTGHVTGPDVYEQVSAFRRGDSRPLLKALPHALRMALEPRRPLGVKHLRKGFPEEGRNLVELPNFLNVLRIRGM